MFVCGWVNNGLNQVFDILFWFSTKVREKQLDHFSEKWVDHLISASKVTTINKVVGLLSPSTNRCVELEVPQELVGSLEVWSNRVELMDQIFHADYVTLTYK